MLELSVVIPTFNRAGPLRRCLEALSRQTCAPDEFEVVVVVDGSTDGTLEMLAQLKVPFALRVASRANAGQAAALNHGLRVACGRVCVLLDDDIVAEPRLLAEHRRVQAEAPVVAVGHMTCQVPPGADGFAHQFAAWWHEHYAALETGRQPTFMDCWSGNLSAPRHALLDAGGFAEDLPRLYDVELAYRLWTHGLKFRYVAGAIGHQEFTKSGEQIAADAERAGVASVEIYRRHPPTLPHLDLGRFGASRLRYVLLKKALLRLNVSPRRLARVIALLSRGGRANSWYGLLFDYCYWRGVRSAVSDDTWRRLTTGVLVLMYHAFARPGERPSRYVVPARQFARQMSWLRRRGYHVLPLREFVECRRRFQLPPPASVVLTIDDGYADVRDVALPELQRHQLPATLFVVSGSVGRANGWDHDSALAGRPLLTWQAIRDMRDGLIEVGAHTRTHPRLTGLPPDMAWREIDGSRRDLERELGPRPVPLFAYPFGAVDQVGQRSAEHAGFLAACGIEPGFNWPDTPLLCLRRAEVHGTDSMLRFMLTVRLGDAIRNRRRVKTRAP